jgi:hypothetical protein
MTASTNRTPGSDWLIWDAVYQPGFCVCTTLQGYEEAFKLKRGSPVGEAFPEDAHFDMNPDFPDDIKLGDNIKNTGGFILVSKALRDLLETAGASNLEYLAVRIINHKGRLASADYFIINPLAVYDAIDFAQSVVKRNNINPDSLSSVSKLVIDPSKVPPEATLFRLKAFERRVVVRRQVADRLTAAGLVGIGFTDVTTFRGF